MSRRWTVIAAGTLGLLAVVAVVLSILTDEFPDEFLRYQGHVIFDLVRQHGEATAVVLLYFEESGVPMPVPGDAFVMFLGHRLATGPLPAILVCLTITGAVVSGASNLFVISRRWGRRIVEGKAGTIFHVTPRRLERAERWFARWGALALIFGRHIPGFRVPITVAAGVLGVSYRTFALSVAISTITWSAFFLTLGRMLGNRVSAFIDLHRHATALTMAGVAALAIVYVCLRLLQLSGAGVSLRRWNAGRKDGRSSRP